MATVITTDPYATAAGSRLVFDVSGTPYVVLGIFGITNALAVFKKTGGSFAEQDAGDRPAEDDLLAYDARLVGTTIHIAYLDDDLGTDNRVRYVTFDCSTDQWGSPETALTFTADMPAVYFGCRLGIDTDGYPHIAYGVNVGHHGTDYAQVYHIHKTVGGWQAAARVSSGDQVNHKLDSVTMDSAYRFSMIYHDASAGTVFHRSRKADATYDTENTAHASGVTFGAALHSIAVDSSDVRKLAVYDIGGNLDVQSGTSGANPTWSSDGADIDGSIEEPSIGVDSGGTNRYVVYKDGVPGDTTIRLAKRENGSYSHELLESESGDDLKDAFIENPTRAGRFHYIFYNNTDTDWYHGEYGAAAAGPPPMNVVSKLVKEGLV
jgi:hypothetical protein